MRLLFGTLLALLMLQMLGSAKTSGESFLVIYAAVIVGVLGVLALREDTEG